jgi:hypothetical protein
MGDAATQQPALGEHGSAADLQRSAAEPGQARRQNTLSQLEHRIRAQGRDVVAVLIAGSDHQHAEPDHVGEAMNHLRLRARIVETIRQPLGNAKALFEFPQHQHAGIGGQLPAVKARHNGFAENR